MPDADTLIADAVAALRGADVRDAERKLDRLVVGTGTTDGAAAVDVALLNRLVAALARLWPRGWQPVDVARIVTRRLGPRPARLLVDGLAAQRRTQVGHVPSWWDDQLAGLAARVRWDDDADWLTGWA
ncbi:hypothetical protein E1182_29620, partial [Micromonospora sp. KC721]